MANDGGQAFPQAGSLEYHPVDGMTLRDWFAGQIIAAIYSGGIVAGGFSTPDGRNTVASLAYRQAEAMLAERDKTKA
jgi:hypothetical protein